MGMGGTDFISAQDNCIGGYNILPIETIETIETIGTIETLEMS